MLKIKVKAGSITNLTDARYFAAREVEWLGFPIGSGDGMIEPLQVKAIAEWVDGVEVVGEFGFSNPEEIKTLCELIGLETIQVGMFISQEEMNGLQGLSIIKEVIAGFNMPEQELEDHLKSYQPYCEYFLLNLVAEGHDWQQVQNGIPYSADFLKSICQRYKIILHMDCSAEDVAKIVLDVAPFALNLSGGEEEKVGVKSFDDLDEILDALEIE